MADRGITPLSERELFGIRRVFQSKNGAYATMMASRPSRVARTPAESAGGPTGPDIRISRPVTTQPIVQSTVIDRSYSSPSIRTEGKPQIIKKVAIGATIAAGAGLLAKGVKALFGPEARARRAARRAERRGEEAGYTPAEAQAAGQSVAEQVTAQVLAGQGISAAPMGPPPPAAPLGKMDVGELLKKYWWVALIAFVVLGGGGKFLKPKRRAPRRRNPAPAARRRAPARKR